MAEILFRCSCPATGCNNSEIYTWKHGECPSSSSYYISDEGILRCDNCNKKFPLFSRRWKSSSCDHEHRETDLTKAMYIFCVMHNENRMPRDFYRKLIRNLMGMWDQLE